MSKIHLLSEDIINKIAAGEVIERPASLVKELIENSLDAKATNITITIENSGKRRIRVDDNGEGMSREDAEKSILRHATSKIKDESNLFAINTLGFRGEALASIAAISQLTLITKEKNALEGIRLELEAGRILTSTIIGADVGTSIDVKNIFFNTPARKKFLKTDAVELRHIIDTAIHYALINPPVAFRLIHDQHELLHSPAVSTSRDKIASIYGITIGKTLLEVQHNEGDISITGFVASPFHARNDKTQQHIYVNARWIRSEEISQAVHDAFHSMLFVNKHPVFMLNIQVNPEQIDVNVHPAKTQVKFEQKEQVYQAVHAAVQATLRQHNLIPVVGLDAETQATFGTPQPSALKTESTYPFEPSRQTVFYVQEEAEDLLSNEVITPQSSLPAVPELPLTVPSTSKFPELKLLGQIHKTFFVAETVGGFFLIDQHAAHERVLYEELLDQFQAKQMDLQYLLQGEIIDVSATEKILIQEYKQLLQNFGFTLENFGENTFQLTTIPTILGRTQPREMLYELLSTLQEGKNKIEQVQEQILTRMACRAAIMAGDIISLVEMDSILKELASKKDPYTCPHGRPVMIKTDIVELEKKFKRRG